jgi:HD-GYP domain-containing protein (c-di-GMP phosphodiesterase class II)
LPQNTNELNEEMLDSQLHLLIKSTIEWVLILTTPIIALAVFRNIKADDHRTTTFIILLFSAILCLNLLKDKLSRPQIAWILFSILFIYANAILWTLGLASAGPYVLVLCAFGVATFLPLRPAIVGLVLSIIPLFIVTAAVTFDFISPIPVASLGFLDVPHTWVVTTLVAMLLNLVIFIIVRQIRTIYLDQSTNYRRTLFSAMGALSILRDNETGNHVYRCGLYAETLLFSMRVIGNKEALQIPKQYLRQAIELHDIGKIAISDAILKKPGKLTKDEFEAMKLHTVIGADMIGSMLGNSKLENDASATLAQQIALSHHENFDGTGYPFGAEGGMVGKNIPFAARLMAIIDVYDALRSTRPYKKPFTHEEALVEMERVAKSKFDPTIYQHFRANADEFDRIYSENNAG